MMRLAFCSTVLVRCRTLDSVAAAARPAVTWTGRQQNSRQNRCRLHTSTNTSCRSRCGVVVAAGMPFSLSRPQKSLKFKWGRRFSAYTADDVQVEVDALAEGRPKCLTAKGVDDLLQQLEQDAQVAVLLALKAKQEAQPQFHMPAIINLSLVLCDDEHIQQLNKEHRGKDSSTDVLSFEIPDEPFAIPLPVKLLGDLVISVDTAQCQAAERGYPLLSELRVLLVHGLLHLCGFDHEQGEQQLQQMALLESQILSQLGWEGSGLISAATTAAQQDDGSSTASSGAVKQTEIMGDSLSSTNLATSRSSSDGNSSITAQQSSSSSNDSSTSVPRSASRDAAGGGHKRGRHKPPVSLVALDMDGTLLDSSSTIPPESAAVIRAATAAGVRVILATGKARPAAVAACRKAGLEGDGLLVSHRSPGVFLQGLAVHGEGGHQLSDAALPAAVVAQAFTWAAAADVSCVAFLGDECVTLRVTRELEELHTRYYEPLAQERSNLQELLHGPAVRKLLFMTDPERVESLLKPHWMTALQGQAAELLQAVPNMLEIVPSGVNKWAGLQVLLGHMQLTAEGLMAVGDGSNDLQMVSNAGLGIAMGNAVPSVKAAAAVVVSSNDEGGIVEAFERFVL